MRWAEPRNSVPSTPFTADVVRLRCAVDRSAVLDAPGGAAVSELLYGDVFVRNDEAREWSGGWCAHDDYPGYVRASDFSPAHAYGPTHRVIVRTGLIFAMPDIKSASVGRPPLSAALHARGQTGMFLELSGGFIHRRHVCSAANIEPDPVAIAHRLLGAPYLWGGRSGEGIDCSGLVQIALMMCGIAAPRDTGPQSTAIGHPIEGTLRRGDLVFFPGHVGLMTDGEHLLHANAHWMTTLIEPLADVIARLRPLYAEPVRAIRRLHGLSSVIDPG